MGRQIVNMPIYCTQNIVYKPTITNMVTTRNLEVKPDKFNAGSAESVRYLSNPIFTEMR
jgi:hypothetical protein